MALCHHSNSQGSGKLVAGRWYGIECCRLCSSLADLRSFHRKDGKPYLAEALHPDTGSFEGHALTIIQNTIFTRALWTWLSPG